MGSVAHIFAQSAKKLKGNNMVEGINFAMTTVPTILLWVIGLIVFGVGAFLGYVNMNIDARKKIEMAENNAQIIRTEAEKKLEEAKKLGGVDTPSLLRIKNDTVGMVVEMDGKILSTPLSAEGKKRLLELISVFRPFIDGQTQQPVVKPVVQKAASDSLTVPPPVPATVNRSAPSTEVKPVSILNPGVPPKKLDPEKEFALLSIVQQIDSVLQKKLEGTPLEGAGIRLQESANGDLEVFVGLQKFTSIDDVTDEKIKSVIRAAIAEWESKYVPGM